VTRLCAWCRNPIPARARRDAVCCSVRCRQARHRFLRAAGYAGQVTGRPVMLSVAGLGAVPLAEANQLVTEWGHDLGPISRPFGSQAWVLHIGGDPVSVAVSVSTVARITAGYHRTELVELSRLCSCQPWANRVMLQLWREVAARRWPHWEPAAAVSYPLNARHDGQLYRFDGWEKITTDAGPGAVVPGRAPVTPPGSCTGLRLCGCGATRR